MVWEVRLLMKKNYTNSFLLNALHLPVINDFESLANNIGISQRLVYLLANDTKKYYKSFEIPKKNGNLREIKSPLYSLKLVQRWILKEIFEKINVSEEAMAFKKGPGSGIKKNAEYHKYSLFLLEIDLKDFFTTISIDQVYFLFKSFGYNSQVSYTLAKLCTYDGYLPQGGVCSPYISNLICYKLDKRLKGLCSRRDILYTRYADDLTFSCDNKTILKKNKKIIEEIISNEGFSINPSKTRFLSPASRKKITGITVNDNRIKADKALKKKVRAMIHRTVVTGNYDEINIIRGYISYINSIEDGYKDRISKYINTLIKKEYKYFKNVVTAYNSNKFFKELNSMSFDESLEYNYDDFEIYYMYEKIVDDRKSFLNRLGIVEEELYNPIIEEIAMTQDEDDNIF